jgi:hypothetical protein
MYFGNLVSRFDPIIEMESDGILDIVKDFFTGFTLCITTKKFREECSVAIFIFSITTEKRKLSIPYHPLKFLWKYMVSGNAITF